MNNQKKVVLKMLVLGPVCSGKSTISDYLIDAEELVLDNYIPTQGVRILEFESNQLEVEEENVKTVELWDCSGDHYFEDCWPAITKNANSAILVCNPELHTGADLLIWYSEFVQKGGINPKNVLVLLNSKSNNNDINSSTSKKFKMPKEMQNLLVKSINVETEDDSLRLTFIDFLSKILERI